MAESSIGHRTALCLSEHQFRDFILVCICSAAVCFKKWGLREQGESLRTALHCDMSDPLLQSLQHEQGKRYFGEAALMSSLCYHDFFWVHSVFPCCEEVVSPARSIWLESCVTPECSVYRKGHRSWWPFYGFPLEVSVVFVRGTEPPKSCHIMNIGRLRLWSLTIWV